MKKLLLLLLLPVCLLGQEGYVKVGLGLRTQPFWSNISSRNASELKSFYLNPSLQNSIGVSFELKNSILIDLLYSYYSFDGYADEGAFVSNGDKNNPFGYSYNATLVHLNVGMVFYKSFYGKISIDFRDISQLESDDGTDLEKYNPFHSTGSIYYSRGLHISPTIGGYIVRHNNYTVDCLLSPFQLSKYGFSYSPYLSISFNYKLFSL